MVMRSISARAVVDRELASCGGISWAAGCSVRRAGGKILDVDDGFLSALGYWLGGCIAIFIGF
jgi:hypothetical protein